MKLVVNTNNTETGATILRIPLSDMGGSLTTSDVASEISSFASALADAINPPSS